MSQTLHSFKDNFLVANLLHSQILQLIWPYTEQRTPADFMF